MCVGWNLNEVKGGAFSSIGGQTIVAFHHVPFPPMSSSLMCVLWSGNIPWFPVMMMAKESFCVRTLCTSGMHSNFSCINQNEVIFKFPVAVIFSAHSLLTVNQFRKKLKNGKNELSQSKICVQHTLMEILFLFRLIAFLCIGCFLDHSLMFFQKCKISISFGHHFKTPNIQN